MIDRTWTLVKTGQRSYELLTGPGEWTKIRVSKLSHVNVSFLIKCMEIHGVPVAYARFLQRISITRLQTNDDGLYYADILQLSGRERSASELDRVFVHELAHHLYDHGIFRINKKLKREFKKRSEFMPDDYAQTDVEEYVAVGMEVYYFATKAVKSRMKKKNPLLYSLIKHLHRSHVNSGI